MVKNPNWHLEAVQLLIYKGGRGAELRTMEDNISYTYMCSVQNGI